jgi:hypothetical protein
MLVTICGAVGGFILGANIGGNWMTSAHLGTLQGYELTALIGTITGALLAGVAALFTLRRRH